MHMHRFLKPLALAAVIAAASLPAHAQTISWNPRTGDVWMDTQLNDMNRYGTSYRDPFINEMVRYQGAPRDLITDLLVNRNWAPGDVYYACNIAQVIGRPCSYVANEWERDRGQGWGVVARRMGIKPGSAEFHRLKNGFVPTYDRWSRPITLDNDLRRVYPNHGKSKAVVSHNRHPEGRSDKGSKPGKAAKGNSGKQTSGKSDNAHGKANGHGNGKGKGKH